MSAWLNKVTKFKSLLAIKVSDHKSNISLVRSNLRSLAEKASAVQPRLMFEFALAEPGLIHIPENAGGLRLTTVYDIIQYNMVEMLISIGQEYLETLDE